MLKRSKMFFCFKVFNCQKSLALLFIVMPFFFTSAGCSLDASIQSLSRSVEEVFSKPLPSEITSGSSQNLYSTRGYIVQSSVNNQDTPSEGRSTRGFKVYTSVQGSLFKE